MFKGHIKSEWIYEVDISPNYQQKMIDFYPASLYRIGTYVGHYVPYDSTHSGVSLTYLA